MTTDEKALQAQRITPKPMHCDIVDPLFSAFHLKENIDKIFKFDQNRGGQQTLF